MLNAELDDAQAQTGIKSAGRDVSNLRYAEDTALMAENEEELKSLLMEVKEGSEKVGLKLNIQKARIVASGPITSWQINGETMETVRGFLFLGSKIIANCDCSHKIERQLLLGRKSVINLDSILKSRDITLLTKVSIVKARMWALTHVRVEVVHDIQCSHVQMWELDYKKAECRRIDALELWGWRRLLTVPCTQRRSNQSILKEISLEYSLEGLRLKLKLQYLGHLMQRADSLEKTLMLGKVEGRKKGGWQRMRWLDGITDSMDMSLSTL